MRSDVDKRELRLVDSELPQIVAKGHPRSKNYPTNWNFTTVSVHRKVSETIDELIKDLKLPSGSPKYRSKSDFVNEACERLIAEEKKPKESA